MRRNPNPDKNLDLDKTLKLTVDFIGYTIMISIGLWCVRDYKGIPSSLGGSGSCRTVGWNWPEIEFNSGMRIYSFVQHGYHLQSNFAKDPFSNLEGTIIHLLTKRDHSNFLDMAIHHICTMLSINYAYFTNFEDYSVLATLISNFSDFFLNFGKFLRDVGLKAYLVTISFVTIFISWLVTRVAYFPYCNYVSTEKFQPLRGFEPFPRHSQIW